MPRAKPAIVKLADLKVGELGDCFALLVERNRVTTQTGKQFFNCRFRDADTVIPAAIWADSKHYADCEQHWRPGQSYKIRASRKETDRYGPAIEIDQIRLVNDGDKADGFDLLSMIEPPRVDPNQLFGELKSFAAANMTDGPLRELVGFVLDQYHEQMLLARGSAQHYYPYAGGWLQHTLSVTKNCKWLGDRYRENFPELKPPLNIDLLLAGAMLHDVGRVVEFAEPTIGEATPQGRMIGHISLGRDIVRDAARNVPSIDFETLMLLDHLILSHLTLPEWGSPRLPAIPEVLILHHADDLDAKMEMYVRCLTRDHSPGPFTDKDPILGKQLYKARNA